MRGRPLDQGAGQLVAQVGEQVEPFGGPLEEGGAAARLEPVERRAHVGQPEDRVTQRTQLARSGATQRRAPRQPLQVPHAVQRLPYPVAAARVMH